MAAKKAPPALVMSCTSVSRSRGGATIVSLTPKPGAPENRAYFGEGSNAHLSIHVTAPEGQDAFDPEVDYLVTFQPVK